jgi:hypothetical protein
MQPTRRLAFLSAAVIAVIAAVLTVVLSATLASASMPSAARNGVGAQHPGMIFTVGVSHGVSAGEGRGRAVPQPRFASGLCVAAEDTGGTLGEAKAGQTVYRVWGRDPANPDLASNQSGPWGHSWTRVDPASVAKYRDVAGLPDEANLGRFVSQGILQDTTGVEVREALQLGTNAGGLDELLIPNPEAQVLLQGVFGVNPPF